MFTTRNLTQKQTLKVMWSKCVNRLTPVIIVYQMVPTYWQIQTILSELETKKDYLYSSALSIMETSCLVSTEWLCSCMAHLFLPTV